MMRTWLAIACLACAGGAYAQQDALPRELLLLTRIKAHMAASLSSLPNYICLETIERARRKPRAREFTPVDTIRLEVAQVGGKELFAWPGAGRIEEADLSRFASQGTIGNGIFALHARTLFVSNTATFHYFGEENIRERGTVRYDYRLSHLTSGYTIAVGAQASTVACHGSFWADLESLDVLRIELLADEIPPALGLADAVTTIEYARARIGASDVLLPERAELLLTEFSGAASRNRISFSGCRQYGSESVIRFEEPAAPAAKKP